MVERLGLPDTANGCKRCGICCTKGGPALHSQDLSLVKGGKIARKRLITIRRGELVYKPFSVKPQRAINEFVKICGTGREWQCFYFNSDIKGCNIYENRPITCSTLQCWDTAAVEGFVENDTLKRCDIIEMNDPMFIVIEEHERKFPCPDMEAIVEAIGERRHPFIGPYNDLVNEDILYRTAIISQYNISLADELFFFGRPIFQLLQQLGVTVTEARGVLKLRWPKIRGT